jgi:hypothetical protein
MSPITFSNMQLMMSVLHMEINKHIAIRILILILIKIGYTGIYFSCHIINNPLEYFNYSKALTQQVIVALKLLST